MIKVALFDFDGTLANTDAVHHACWNQALRVHNVAIDIGFYAKHCSGALSLDIAQDILISYPEINMTASELAHQKDDFYSTRLLEQRIPTMDGVKEILSYLSERGIRLGIVTGAPEPAILKTLSDNLILDYFESKVTREDISYGKPSPEGYLLALSRFKATPEQSVSFEDTESGVLAAQAAGILSIAIPNVYTRSHNFAKSDFVCADMFRAKDTIEQILRYN